MAQQHTTPQRSLAAAYAAEQRAQAGSESRLRKDTCYGLYEASLKCLDQNDYNRDACEEAFDAFKACRSNQKASKAGGEGTSAFASMIKAQEQDPLIGPIIKLFNWWGSSQEQQPEPAQPPPEPEPEWKVAKRLREEQQQLEQEMRQVQAVLQEQEVQQHQQRGSSSSSNNSRRRWFWFGGPKKES